MTTYFSDFMLSQIAAGYTFPGKNIGIALLYSAAVVDDSTPTSLAGLKAAPGFQEVSKVACPTYGTGTGVLVTQGVNGVVLDATNHPGVVTVIYGSDWLPIGTGATAESVYVAAVVFYIVGPVAGVTDPWMMITTDPVGVVVDPGARITNTTKQLFSYSMRPGTSIVDAAPVSLYQSPGTLDWESARVQHVYMFPQRVNWIPNPSFEDVGNFGWRSNGTMSRLTPGVDSSANHFVRTAGTVLESIAVPIASIFRFSAWVRSAGGQGIVFALDCLDDAYVSRGLVANGERPLYADWIRYDELLYTIDDTLAVVPHIEADGPFDCDLCLLESIPALNTYYDGSSNTGLPGDFSWQAQEAQSYSFWYNNRYVTAARLFGEYVTGPVTLPSLVLDWLPTGTAVYTHWDVLSQFDTKHPLKDWPSRLIP